MSVNPKKFNATAGIDVRRVAGRIGAEISGVRLSGSLDARTVGDIRYALLHHKVIFFRGQQHLDDAEQERFARLFGELVAHPTEKVRDGSHAILELDTGTGSGRADQWHTDVTFVDAYPKISVLRGVVIPPFGGDTVWSNTAAAYVDLPVPLQRLADELWAVHSNAYDYAVKSRATAADRKHFDEVFTGTIYETEHPVVRVHPELLERTRELISLLGERPEKEIAPGSEYRMLASQEIREMAGSGLIDFGAHTCSHAILSGLSPAERTAEIAGSLAAIERLSGAPCRLFAYPNGRRIDYGPADVAALAAGGIAVAVTTVEGPTGRTTAPLEMHRYGIGGETTLAKFQLLIHHLLWKLAT